MSREDGVMCSPMQHIASQSHQQSSSLPFTTIRFHVRSLSAPHAPRLSFSSFSSFFAVAVVVLLLLLLLLIHTPSSTISLVDSPLPDQTLIGSGRSLSPRRVGWVSYFTSRWRISLRWPAAESPMPPGTQSQDTSSYETPRTLVS